MDFKKLPELTRVRQLLEYDPLNGGFIWKSGQYAGKHAGCTKKNKYVMIRIDYNLYCEHRLVWYFFNELDPDVSVDHIDNDPSNNKIDNLRLANNRQQMKNSRSWKNSKVKYKGVFPITRHNKYFARIRVDGKYLYLGSFLDPFDAHKAYCEAANKYHGEFANFGKRQ